MPNVVGPMFSVAASGDLGNAITFVCGKKVRKKASKEKKNKGLKSTDKNSVTPAQAAQRQKFSAGKDYWKNTMSEAVREEWRSFAQIAMSDSRCANKGFTLTGYNAFIKFYNLSGLDGWPEFPSPPHGYVK